MRCEKFANIWEFLSAGFVLHCGAVFTCGAFLCDVG
jgi:hypothetical protein